MSHDLPDITNVRPEIDPEADPFACSSEDDENFDLAQEHYEEVGQSRLRTDADELLDETYQGNRASRRSIYDSTNEVSSELEDSEDSDGEEELELSTLPVAKDEDSSEVASDEVSGDESRRREYQNILAQDKRINEQQIQEQAVANHEKGQQVKLQRDFYNSLLDVRIKLQRALVASECVVENDGINATHITTAEQRAISLINSIFELRDRHLSNLLDEQEVKPSLKRLREETHNISSEEIWKAIEDSNTQCISWKEKTLVKWSRKVAANAPPMMNKFKSLNQDSLSQIRENLTDKDRLIQRTRLKRTKTDDVDRKSSTFDDTDFYQFLLKDLIDKKMLDSSTTCVNLLKKEKRVTVDTKASKGRKLRYHVHEKLLNFMTPIPTGLWHDSQTDELYSSLFGKKAEIEGTGVDQTAVDSIRLYA